MTKNNNMPQGYKESPLGIIPKGWEVKKLREVCEIKGGYAFDSKTFKSKGKYQIVKMSNLYEGILDLSRSQSFINDIPKSANESFLIRNDIIITLTGTVGKTDYGYSYQIKDETNLLLNQRVGKIVGKNIDSAYLYKFLKTPRFLTQFFYSSRGGTGNQSNVSTNDIADIFMIYPPIAEQKKIAEILSVWDEAIEKQTQLIAQFKTRKRGLMQQLLTGKKRVKGFSEKWEEVKLGDIAKIYQPQTIQGEDFIDYGYPVYGANGFIGYYHSFNHETGQTVITCRGSSCGTVNFTPANCWITGNAMVINVDDNKDIDKTFLNYLISNLSFQHLISGSGQPQIIREPLLKFMLSIPLFDEQTAIANILSAADSEINLAKQKLANLKEQKKGLMQVLLTGKKRVKI